MPRSTWISRKPSSEIGREREGDDRDQRHRPDAGQQLAALLPDRVEAEGEGRRHRRTPLERRRSATPAASAATSVTMITRTAAAVYSSNGLNSFTATSLAV